MRSKVIVATTPTARSDTSAGHRLTRRPARGIVTAGLAAAVGGAVLLYGYGSAASAVGMPMRAGDPWADTAQQVTAANFAVGVVVCTFWGTILALALAQWAERPADTFVRIATVLVIGSLAVPLAAVDTAPSTRIGLAIGHLLAAALIVPLLVKALNRAETGR